LPAAEQARLVRFLRGLQRAAERPVVRMTVHTTGGATLEGQLVGEGFDDLQLRTDDKRVHLLRRTGQGPTTFRSVTSDTNWTTYNGDPGGNRYSPLTQINTDTVRRLAPRWTFTIPDAGNLQATPLVVDGILYITGPNECYALDAGSGRPI